MICLLAFAVTLHSRWIRLPNFPISAGIASPFAGVSHGILLVAGGSNFPTKPPWAGGKKVYYRNVYALTGPKGKWHLVGQLPQPIGYGVSVTFRNKVICVGGSDLTKAYHDSFTLEWDHGKLHIGKLPAFPETAANACGALVGSTLYIAGGQVDTDSINASNRAYALNLVSNSPHWEEISSLPESGRILATAASFEGKFWVIGGASLHPDSNGNAQRTYLKSAYFFSPNSGWKRVADLPYPEVAAPSPAPTFRRGILILGGDDGSQVNIPQSSRKGFSKILLQFDPFMNRWTKEGNLPISRVTVPAVWWHGMWVIINGEKRPGIRSNEVWGFQLRNN